MPSSGTNMVLLLYFSGTIVPQKTLAISVNDGSGTCAPAREQFLPPCVVLPLHLTDLNGNLAICSNFIC